jgi:hypothetical protein
LLLSVLAAAQNRNTITVDHGAQDPAVSPDGKTIAVTILGKIWTVPASGGRAELRSHGLGWDTHPAFSPSGRFLAYSHHLAAGDDLIVQDLATGTEAPLYRTQHEIGEIRYSPGGGEIFFVVLAGQYDAHLQRIPTTGGDPKPVTETQSWHEWNFAVSPDVAAIFTSSGHYGGANLYRIALKDLHAQRLTTTRANQAAEGWTRDNRLVYIETSNGEETIYAMPSGGGAAQKIYSGPYRDSQLALDPDGKTAVLCAARKLQRLDLETGNVKPIPFMAEIQPPAQAAADLTIIHARLLDGMSGSAQEDATIEIHNGRVTGVRSGGATANPASTVIDAKNKTVLPGLMDNHYHFWDIFDGARLLERGVTTIRDPGSALSHSLNFKEAIALGLYPGPDIYTAGPLIDGYGGYHPMVDVEIDDPAKAGALVDSLKQQGVDLLKVYFLLRPEVLCAVIQQAHHDGLKVTGHIGVKTSWNRAIDCGIDGVNHIRVWADFLPLSEQPQGEDLSLDATIHTIARMQADWHSIDPQNPQVVALIRKMAASHVGFDPTLSIQKVSDQERKGFSLQDFTLAQDAYARMGQFVATAEKDQVLLLAGTDDGSIFDEAESYEAAGVPRPAIIKALTGNGAIWLGRESDFGRIAPGQKADLVMVDGDPLKQMKDLRNVSVVVKDGRVVFEK